MVRVTVTALRRVENNIEMCIRDRLKRYANEQLMDITIAKYETGTGLLYEIEDGACFDAVFLDIYLGDMLGIDPVSYTHL